MHERTHSPGAGNGSQADHKRNNNAIQTRKLSQYIARSAGKSKKINFLGSSFPQDYLFFGISFLMNLGTMLSKNISEFYFCAQSKISREATARARSGKKQLTLLLITATVLGKVSLKSEGRLRWTPITRGMPGCRGYEETKRGEGNPKTSYCSIP